MNNPNRQASLLTIIIVALVAVNFIFLIIAQLNSTPQSSLQDNRNLQESGFLRSVVLDPNTYDLSGTEDLPPYEFTDPDLAYKVLTLLDVFEPVNNSYLGWGKLAVPEYEKPYLGLKNDDDYCKKHRAVFVERPEIVFKEFNFIMEQGPVTLLRRKAAAVVGTDIMPKVGKHLAVSEFDSFMFDINPAATAFWTVMGMQRYKSFGQHFGCLSQEFNHIPGHFSLNRKDTIAENAMIYGQKFQDRPQCFSHKKYFPETWLLYQQDSCLDFFRRINHPDHLKNKEERSIQYIKKVAVGSHRGIGVTPLGEADEEALQAEYKHGALCGTIQKLMIVQHYIPNPLLLEGRKFDFRMYMVVGSSNPLMVFYHDGFLRVSLYDYDEESTDKKVLLTNLALNKEVYDDAAKGRLSLGRSTEELRLAQQWSFERLQDYLLQQKVIDDPNWLDNYLRPEFKRAMIHLVKMASHTFLKASQAYEFYGVDFMLDENLTLWFIEANSGPALDGYSAPMEKFIVKMLKDHFEIVKNMLRSRMKRVVLLVNKIIKNEEVVQVDEENVELNNLEKWREAFKEVSANRFEPEFQLSADNGYSLIYDENLEGSARYMGLFSEECL